MSFAKSFAGVIRLPFLILTPACVLLGLGVAVWLGKPVDWLYFAIVMVGAIAAHICVNSFNEYFDFRSGLDEKTVKTLIPKLKKAGAQGIIEYPLNKVIY